LKVQKHIELKLSQALVTLDQLAEEASWGQWSYIKIVASLQQYAIIIRGHSYRLWDKL